MFPILIGVLIITWFLTRMMSVDPTLNVAYNVSDPIERMKLIEAERLRMGYYDPWYIQIGIYIKNILTGDWGKSYAVAKGKPVIVLMGEIFPKTLELAVIPIIIVPIIAVKLGVFAAYNKDKSQDVSSRFIAIVGSAFPAFWVGILLQMFFGIFIVAFSSGEIVLPIFYSNTPGIESPVPPGGFDTGFRIINAIIYNDQFFLWDTIFHLILPVSCLTLLSLSGIIRQTRSSMLEVLDQDYIRTARAKGLEEDVVINKHALRNALIPTSNLIIGNITGTLLGSFYLEVVFNYTGYGYWFIQSINTGDYLVIMGFIIFSSFVIMGGNLVADVLYTIIDPRIIYK